jgi:hypothetical protein
MESKPWFTGLRGSEGYCGATPPDRCSIIDFPCIVFHFSFFIAIGRATPMTNEKWKTIHGKSNNFVHLHPIA